MPCYLKSHSQGEYVFDRGWADAYERAGGRYYPKLQVSVPFTPATGPRLLIRDGVDRASRSATRWRAGWWRCASATEASSVHVTFAREDEASFLAEHGFLQRTDQQFHWHNAGYASFDDFLATLASRKRKAIKRERRDALANGITIHALTGADITEEAWDAFFAFYMETGSRKWGRPYLTRDVLLADRREHGRRRAAGDGQARRPLDRRRDQLHRLRHAVRPALGRDRASSRSCISRSATIRRSILRSRGLAKTVEAGAQGEHKIARGYLPQTTYSAHYIADPALRRASRRLSEARARLCGAKRFAS